MNRWISTPNTNNVLPSTCPECRSSLLAPSPTPFLLVTLQETRYRLGTVESSFSMYRSLAALLPEFQYNQSNYQAVQDKVASYIRQIRSDPSHRFYHSYMRSQASNRLYQLERHLNIGFTARVELESAALNCGIVVGLYKTNGQVDVLSLGVGHTHKVVLIWKLNAFHPAYEE